MRTTVGRCGLVAALLVTSLCAGSASAATPGAQPPELIQVLRVAGRHGIPADAAMVAANVTAVHPLGPGFLTVFPCDGPVPPTSNVNYPADGVVPNLVLSRVSAEGTICVATSHVSDILVDVVGYVPQGSAISPLDTPVRLADTRAGNVPPRPAGSTLEVDVTGPDEVPDDAMLAMLNVTAVGQDQPGYLRVTPCGAAPGNTSSVNHLPRQVVPNLVVTRIGTNGKVCIYTLAAAHIVVDVSATATAGLTTLARPVRILDTRSAGGARPAGTTTTIDVTARNDVPDDATAAIYNLTATGAGAPGYATSHPCLASTPLVSNLNYRPGAPVANGAITALSATGKLCIYNLTPTQLVVDLIGYTRDTAHYVPITPKRIWDTRNGWQPTCDWVIGLPQWKGPLRAGNLSSGQVIDLPRTADLLSRGLKIGGPPFVDTSCTHAYYGLRRQTANGWRSTMFRFSFSDRTVEQVAVVPDGLRLADLADGSLVTIDSSGKVTDLEGSVIFEKDIGVNRQTRDGYTYLKEVKLHRSGVIAYLIANDRRERIELWNTLDGTHIRGFDVPRPVSRLDLSDDLRYLSVDVQDVTKSTETYVFVMTLFGDVVDAVSLQLPHDGSFSLGGWFGGNGSLYLCAYKLGFYRWDLFSPPTVVMPVPNPVMFSSGQSLSPCNQNFLWY